MPTASRNRSVKSDSELFVDFFSPELVPKFAGTLKSSGNLLKIPVPRLYSRPLKLVSGGLILPSVLFALPREF